MTYETLMMMVFAHDPVQFSRWGDGEWNCIFGVNGQNCDGHKYYTDLGIRLAEILRSNPAYTLGLQEFAMNRMGDQINGWLKDNNVNVEFTDADLFHNASIADNLWETRELVKENRVLLVANDVVVRGMSPKNWVEVPRVNCWLEYDKIIRMICDFCDKCHGNPVVLLCSGMMSKVIVDELYWNAPWATALDLGSVFDPYCGIRSRRYMDKIIERENCK